MSKFNGLKSFIVRYNGEFIRVYNENEVDVLLTEKDKEIRNLHKALYKACANWAKCEERISNMDAYDASEYLPSAEKQFRKKAEQWSEMKSKCQSKMEEYK